MWHNVSTIGNTEAAKLTRLAHHWLLSANPTAAQVAERVVIDKLLRTLPRPLRQTAGMRNPQSVTELIKAIELAEVAQHREAGERALPFPWTVVQERRTPEGTTCAVSSPAVPEPRNEPIPTVPP